MKLINHRAMDSTTKNLQFWKTALVFLLVLISRGVFSQEYPISWTDIVGLESNENVLTKITDNGNQNGAAASFNVLAESENGYLVFSVGDIASTISALGLSRTNINNRWQTIEYCFGFNNDNTVKIYESGQCVGEFGSYASGDVFKIIREEGNISYFINDDLIRTNDVPINTELIIDTWIYTKDAFFFDIMASFPPKVNVDISTTNRSYDGLGSISIDIISGTSPYTILWDGATLPIQGDLTDMLAASGLGELISEVDLITEIYANHQIYERDHLQSGLYQLDITDAIGQTFSSEIPVYSDLIWIDTTNFSFQDDTIANTSTRGEVAKATPLNVFMPDKHNFIEFNVEDASLRAMVGFRISTDEQASDISDFEYAIEFDEGEVNVFENGSSVHSESFATSDKFCLAIENGSFEVKKNAVTINTGSNTTSQYVIDFSISSQGQAFSNINCLAGMALCVIHANISNVSCNGLGDGSIVVVFEPFIDPLIMYQPKMFTQNSSSVQYQNYSTINSLFSISSYQWTKLLESGIPDPSFGIVTTQHLTNLSPGIYQLQITGNGPGGTFNRDYIFEVGYEVDWYFSNECWDHSGGTYYPSPNCPLQPQVAIAHSINTLFKDEESGYVQYMFKTQAGTIGLGLDNNFDEGLPSYYCLSEKNSNSNTIWTIMGNNQVNGYSSLLFSQNCQNIVIRIEKEKDGSNHKLKAYVNGQALSPMSISQIEDFVLGAYLSGETTELYNIYTSFPCKPTNNFAELVKKLDGGYIVVLDHFLQFKFEEEYYYGATDDFDCKIYDLNNPGPAISTPSLDYTNTPAVYSPDDQYKEIFLSPVTYSPGFYLLEVTNKKNEKRYLRFKVE